MAKYKLHKDVAGSTSFRYDGKKYETKNVDQSLLKKLFKEGFEYVTELKESKKSTKNDKKENNETND
jgi:hypothetical protein